MAPEHLRSELREVESLVELVARENQHSSASPVLAGATAFLICLRRLGRHFLLASLTDHLEVVRETAPESAKAR